MIAQLPALRRYATGLAGSLTLADDWVQDCIERALRRVSALEEEDKMASWLRAILFNVFIDERRLRNRRGETVGPEILETMSGQGHDPEAGQELSQVLRALAGLTPQHRQVLLLVGVEGMSDREAALEIGLPVGTVMSRLARARDQLRALLEPSGPAAAGRTE